MTMSNMAIEVGAKAGLMNADDKTLAWFEGRGEKVPAPQNADADAVYETTLEFDASAIGPQIAKPHSVDNVSPDRRGRGHADRRRAFLGTCTNGRLEDFAIAASILQGPQGPPRRALHRRAGVSADPARRHRGRLHPDARRGRRRAGHAGLRPVRRHAQRRAVATARTSSRRPTATSRAAWATATRSSTWAARPPWPRRSSRARSPTRASTSSRPPRRTGATGHGAQGQGHQVR